MAHRTPWAHEAVEVIYGEEALRVCTYWMDQERLPLFMVFQRFLDNCAEVSKAVLIRHFTMQSTAAPSPA